MIIDDVVNPVLLCYCHFIRLHYGGRGRCKYTDPSTFLYTYVYTIEWHTYVYLYMYLYMYFFLSLRHSGHCTNRIATPGILDISGYLCSLILSQKPHFGLNWVEIPLREVAADLFISVQPLIPLQRVGLAELMLEL